MELKLQLKEKNTETLTNKNNEATSFNGRHIFISDRLKDIFDQWTQRLILRMSASINRLFKKCYGKGTNFTRQD